MTDLFHSLSVAQILAAAMALPLAYGFLCRLKGITWRTVRAPFVLIHFSGLAYCGTVIFLQPEGAEVLSELFGLCVCACWLWVSLPTWGKGVPQYARSRPAPLDDMPPRKRRGDLFTR